MNVLDLINGALTTANVKKDDSHLEVLLSLNADFVEFLKNDAPFILIDKKKDLEYFQTLVSTALFPNDYALNTHFLPAWRMAGILCKEDKNPPVPKEIVEFMRIQRICAEKNRWIAPDQKLLLKYAGEVLYRASMDRRRSDGLKREIEVASEIFERAGHYSEDHAYAVMGEHLCDYTRHIANLYCNVGEKHPSEVLDSFDSLCVNFTFNDCILKPGKLDN